ncbi:NAD(P)-binding protein [Hesseltinella vesiculosa]|uniref:3-dehydrosphinganine reductase n=1 Tax=Hesseltinella vesiculosa TaxID=101127 RepID=A0A1X2G6L8_9FUNG|nr:NAD(P)-binding protein [Hesseltinella vesiculosa]
MVLPSWGTTLVALGAATVTAIILERIYHYITRPPFEPAGKHCFITGGSTGLGKGLAIELAKAGADITIIARRKAELDNAVIEIKSQCRHQGQKVIAISADVTIKEDIVRAYDEAKIKIGRDPEYVFTCAGAALPKMFLDYDLEDFDRSIKLNFLGQTYAAHQAALRMKEAGIKRGKIVFVSSMLGLLSFAGYGTYSPTKFAIRGLADTLRNELKQYDIDVHIFFPGGILSPGFDQENLTKPEVTKEIEGTNEPQTPEECAKSLIHGLRSGNYMIMVDIVSEILRATTRGVTPANNFFLDTLLALVGQIIASGYALYMDWLVKSLKTKQH